LSKVDHEPRSWRRRTTAGLTGSLPSPVQLTPEPSSYDNAAMFNTNYLSSFDTESFATFVRGLETSTVHDDSQSGSLGHCSTNGRRLNCD
jgi:hypothetical protein